mmetsp:Transcript_48132/g.129111  ORF Transcript_48132/g.129111 Transcript_48132/m.129111 type:complete len:91 (+) Transcript_48132:99-371(+)
MQVGSGLYTGDVRSCGLTGDEDEEALASRFLDRFRFRPSLLRLQQRLRDRAATSPSSELLPFLLCFFFFFFGNLKVGECNGERRSCGSGL